LAHLLGHSSGLTDAAGYAIPAGMRLQDWLKVTGGGCFTAHMPGTQAEYCNLGYILAAAAAEILGGARFDSLAERHVLGPLGITAGFNWAGVPAAARHDRLATYRREGTRLFPQIDAVVAPEGPSTAEGRETPLDGYTLGQHTAAFSPQGGLRMSLAGCLTLAHALSRMDQTPLWTGDPGPNPVFDHYGAGLQLFRAPAFYPRP
jgi:CubicO group peptidase (beta-lactamase class C family)